MFLSCLFLFFVLLVCSGLLFFLFEFFVPALKLRYEGIEELLSTDEFINIEEENLKSKLYNEEQEFSKACEDANITVFANINSGVKDDNKFLLKKRLVYKGNKSCDIFYQNYNSEYEDVNCCIGYGDCQKVCTQDAIVIKNGIAKITSTCNGCGKCVEICPVNLISLTVQKPTIITSGFKFWNFCYKIFRNKK